MDIDNIIFKILEKSNEIQNKNIIVGILGIDGSGKSTLAANLYNEFKNKDINCYLIHGDDFLFNRTIRNNNIDQGRGFYFETFDYEKLFNELVIPLKEEKHLKKELEVLDWIKDIPYKKIYNFEEPGIVIVEGVLLYKKEYVKYFDYKIWLDIEYDVGIKRALNRERDKKYYKNGKEIIERYENRFYKGQRLHITFDNPIENSDCIVRMEK